MTIFSIVRIPARRDNYIYLLHDAASGITVAVDPSDAEPVRQALKEHGWKLNAILATHHHNDHTGGNAELAHETGCEVIGYAGDAHRIPAITREVQDEERFSLGVFEIEVLFIPGHTLGHIAYYLPKQNALFCGDTLFGMGCGRLFEGTPEMMYASLEKLASLPDKTMCHCGHEYTEQNGTFALSIEPNNPYLYKRMEEVREKRARGEATVPFVLGEEKLTNPFLRSASDEIRATLGMQAATPVEVFAELRQRKNNF